MIHDIRDNLWTLISAPIVWAVHLLFSYVVAAISCAKTDSLFDPIDTARIAIAAATFIALVLIAGNGWRVWREWHRADPQLPHDRSTPDQRERLLEFATLLLAALSFVAVVFVALPALFFTDCR